MINGLLPPKEYLFPNLVDSRYDLGGLGYTEDVHDAD